MDIKQRMLKIYDKIDFVIDNECGKMVDCKNCLLFDDDLNECVMGEMLDIIENMK